MIVRLCIVLVCWLAAGVVAVAADFWETKAPEAWSDKEVRRMLSHSPWAVTVTAITANMDLAGRVGGLQGGRVGGFGGRGRAGAGGGVGGDGAGNLGGGTFLPPPDRTRLVVRWASALPIRQALARMPRSTDDDVEPAPPAAPSDDDEDVYRVVVAGIPIGLAMRASDEFADVTTLQRKQGPALHPQAVRFDYEDERLSIEFAFSATDPLTTRDRDVTFRTELGGATIKAVFHLDRMLLQGRLAL